MAMPPLKVVKCGHCSGFLCCVNYPQRSYTRPGAVDLTRGVRALSAHVKRLLQRWWGCAVAREVQGKAPSDAVVLALRRNTVSAPATWVADTVDVHSAAERSPPAIGPPCHPDPDPVARATLAAVLALRPAMSAHSTWNRASASAWSAEPLSAEHECISGFPRTTSSMTTRAARVSGWDRGENRTK